MPLTWNLSENELLRQYFPKYHKCRTVILQNVSFKRSFTGSFFFSNFCQIIDYSAYNWFVSTNFETLSHLFRSSVYVIIVNLAPELYCRRKYYGSFGPRLQKKVVEKIWQVRSTSNNLVSYLWPIAAINNVLYLR